MITLYVKPDNIFLCGYAGKNWGFITLIDERYEHDKGLLEHERTHYKQWKKRPLTMPLRYMFSKNARLEYEAEAYAVQARYCSNKDFAITKFSKLLADTYKLGITYHEAEKVIRSHI